MIHNDVTLSWYRQYRLNVVEIVAFRAIVVSVINTMKNEAWVFPFSSTRSFYDWKFIFRVIRISYHTFFNLREWIQNHYLIICSPTSKNIYLWLADLPWFSENFLNYLLVDQWGKNAKVVKQLENGWVEKIIMQMHQTKLGTGCSCLLAIEGLAKLGFFREIWDFTCERGYRICL